MAQIPTYGDLKVVSNEHPYSPTAFRMPNMPKANVDLGRVDARLQKFLDEQDDARVTVALNELRKHAIDVETGEDGYRNILGGNAMTPDDQGRGLVERVDIDMHDFGERLAGGLTERQQKLFREKAEPIYLSSYGGVSQHVYTQNINYMQDAQLGAIDAFMQSVSADPSNPQGLKEAEAGISEASAKLGEIRGYTPEMAANLKRKNISALYGTAIDSILSDADQNPQKAFWALGVLQSNAKKMLATDVVRARRAISPILENYKIAQDVNALYERGEESHAVISGGLWGAMAANGLSPDKASAALGYYVGVEQDVSAGGHQTFQGKETEPDKATYGASQLTVARAQATAKKHGLQWSDSGFSNDRGYNSQLGLLFYADLLTGFAGDEQKALAAYIASEDAVAKAEKEAEADGTTWFSKMPSEVQDRVAAAQKRIQSSTTVRDPMTGKRMSAFDPNYALAARKWQTAEEARSYFKNTDPRCQTDPMYLERKTQAFLARQREGMASYRQEQENAMSDVINALYANGGDFGKVNPALYRKLDVNQVQALQRKAQAISEGNIASNPEMLAKLADPEVLLNMSKEGLNVATAELNDKDRRAVEYNWAVLKGKQVAANDTRKNEMRGAQMGQVQQAYTPAMGDVKGALKAIPWYAKFAKDNEAGANVLSFTIQQMLGEDAQYRGTKMTPQETYAAVVRLSQNLVPVDGFIGSTNKPVFMLKVADLPNAANTDAKQILKEITKFHIYNVTGHDRAPTDEELDWTLRQVLMLKNPPFVVPATVNFSQPYMQQIETDWKKTNGNKPLDNWTKLRLYLIGRSAGKGTPTNGRDTLADINPYNLLGEY